MCNYGADTYAGGDNVNNREITFKVTSTKFYTPILTLSTKDNVNLTKRLNEEFKRSVYCNKYKSKTEIKDLSNDNITRFPVDASFQGVNRLLALAFNNTTQDVAGNPINNTANRVLRDSHRKYFLPRVEITNYNVLIDGRNFYDQPINDLIKQYDEIVTGKGDDEQGVCYISEIITN